MSRYVEINREVWGGKFDMEVLFNLGRLYQLLGIGHLASHYYDQALKQGHGSENADYIRAMIYSNSIISALLLRNKARALTLMKEGGVRL